MRRSEQLRPSQTHHYELRRQPAAWAPLGDIAAGLRESKSQPGVEVAGVQRPSIETWSCRMKLPTK